MDPVTTSYTFCSATGSSTGSETFRRHEFASERGVRTVPRIDRETGEAVKRTERQQLLEGKLDKAYAAEGAAVLLLPVVLAVVGLVCWGLTSVGLGGPAMAFVGAPTLIPIHTFEPGLFGDFLPDVRLAVDAEPIRVTS